jgi:ketosteroid isomerase-like protein
MSEQDIEVVRVALGEFFATGEPVWELIDENVEIHDHDIMDGSDYRGHDGFRRWLADWADAWSSFSADVEEYIDGGGCVVVVLRMRATGAASGIEIDRQDASVNVVRDGRIVGIDYFNSRAQALEAAGL